MKQYTKHYDFTISDVNKHRDLLLPIEFKTAKRAPAGGFVSPRTGTLTNTHIVTDVWTAEHDRMLCILYKEWSRWITSYELDKLSRKLPEPYTPTEFPETTSFDDSYE